MVNLKIHLLVILLLASTACWGQKSLATKLTKLEIKQTPFSNYIDKSGNTIGCDWNLECGRFSIVFYSVDMDKRKEQIRIKGRTYLSNASRPDSMDRKKYGDTVALFSVHIFLATPFNRTLIPDPEMSFSSAEPDEEGYKKFPYREGDFEITLKVKRDTRLYFVGYNHVLKEYKIGELLN